MSETTRRAQNPAAAGADPLVDLRARRRSRAGGGSSELERGRDSAVRQ